jgi:tetrahydromethanopterin S-methyltransferase subunit G
MATIETDLKDILAKIDERLDRIERKLEALPRIEEKLEGLNGRVNRLEDSQNRQIWALIVAIIGAMIAAAVRFGFTSNP